MNNDPVELYTTGGTWYEAPGCYHRISDNASKTEPATLLATMILDTDVFERDGMDAIIQIDKEYLWESSYILLRGHHSRPVMLALSGAEANKAAKSISQVARPSEEVETHLPPLECQTFCSS